MNSFEMNKILGAGLGTLLALQVLNISANALYAPSAPEKPGFDIAVKGEESAAKPGAAAEPAKPIAELLASANVERGATAAKKCVSCHTFAKGEPNRVGPNLYDIVGRARATQAGFNYSADMKAKGGNWSFEDLNEFLKNPKAFVKGTSMSFAGLPRDSERADVINYLHTLSDKPQPLPTASK